MGSLILKKQNLTNLFNYNANRINNNYVFKGGIVNTIGAVFNKDEFVKANVLNADKLFILPPNYTVFITYYVSSTTNKWTDPLDNTDATNVIIKEGSRVLIQYRPGSTDNNPRSVNSGAIIQKYYQGKTSTKTINTGGGEISIVNPVVFNNTFNSSVNAHNTTWYTNSSQAIVTAPAGCPNSKCLHISQGYKTYLYASHEASSLYSTAGFGENGMLDLTQSYTIECWFYVTDINADYQENGRFLFLRGCGGDPIQIKMNGDRTIIWFVQDEQSDPTILTLTTAPNLWNLNSWNYIALVNNKSSSNRTIFLNGINVSSGSGNRSWNGNDGTLYGTPTANYQWGVGHDFDNGYDVYISNMRWTQRALYTSNFTPSFTNFPNAKI
jgi:hypothetical protein